MATIDRSAGAASPSPETYQEIEDSAEFRELERSKVRFIVPATLFFLVYYFALPVLVGFFRHKC